MVVDPLSTVIGNGSLLGRLTMILKTQPTRILHTMLRVEDLDRSIDFYTNVLGMRVLRRKDYKDGQFTLAFIGYGDEENTAVLELTHNWDGSSYEQGTAFGHVALAVKNIHKTCEQLSAQNVTITKEPGPMRFDEREVIAFIEDPDGYKIELIERE